MKNKKWLIITIVSFILIALETAAVFILILPGYNKNKMFEALRNGKGDQAADYYEKVHFFAAKDIEEDIKGFMVSETNGFLTGQNPYDDYISRIWAVEKIPDFKGSSFECVKNASLAQLIGLYEKGFTEQMLNSGDNLFDIWDDFDDAYFVYDKKGNSLIDNYGNRSEEYFDFIDQGLDDHLKEKYDAFKEGKLDSKAITAYVDVADEFFTENPGYTEEVKEEISQITEYEREIAAISKLIDDGEYFDAMADAKSVLEKYEGELYFEDYKGQISSLYDDAYKEGKESGLAKAKDAADKGDKEAAKDWIARLKEMYGDEVDTSAIEEQLIPDWGKGYMAFLDNLKGNFKAVMSKGPESYKVAGRDDMNFDGPSKHSEDDPSGLNKIWLTDLDGNGVPELMLGDSDNPRYIFTWSKDEVVIVLECGSLMKYDDGGYLYTYAGADREKEEDIEYDMLWQMKGTEAESISVTISAELDGEKVYMVDSNSSDVTSSEEDYNEAREKIVSKCTKDIPSGAALTDYKSYIESYE